MQSCRNSNLVEIERETNHKICDKFETEKNAKKSHTEKAAPIVWPNYAGWRATKKQKTLCSHL